MLISYKFWFIKRDDDGFITEAAVRYFTGDITTATENGVSVTRYRRTARVASPALQSKLTDRGIALINDASGNPAVVFNQAHFGQIKTDDELRKFLNNVLTRFGITPIDEQK